MKKIVLMAVACLTLVSCGMGTKNESSAQGVEVGVPAPFMANRDVPHVWR